MAIIDSGDGWSCKEEYYANANNTLLFTLRNGKGYFQGEEISFNELKVYLNYDSPCIVASSIYSTNDGFEVITLALSKFTEGLDAVEYMLDIDGDNSHWLLKTKGTRSLTEDFKLSSYMSASITIYDLNDIISDFPINITYGSSYQMFTQLITDAEVQVVEPEPPEREEIYMRNPVTVSDMYKYAKKYNDLLLSDFGANNEGFHFWDEYRTKHNKYDKLFNRMFNSFRYFMQEEGQSVNEITEDFTDEVYNHLMINAKKYEELYRVNVINDANYSITDNYNITETMAREIGKEDTNVLGERIDNNERVEGAKTDNKTETLGAYTNSSESVSGERTDSKEVVVGGKTDTKTESLSAYTNTSELDKGAETDVRTNDIAGFNSANYVKDDIHEDVLGERTDITTDNFGAKSNSENMVYGSQTTAEEGVKGEETDTTTEQFGAKSNTESMSYGSQTITDEFTKGEQTDSYTGTQTEDYTLTRKGNIGVRTITEVLEYHEQFWTTYEFYTLIFKEICAELLLI